MIDHPFIISHTLHSYAQTVDLHEKCYDAHAEKFSSTRQKKWPEFAWIGEKVKQYRVKQGDSNSTVQLSDCSTVGLSMLELGCGDGRFAGYLSENNILKDNAYHYTGVDIASGLLKTAKEKYPDHDRVHQDMVGYVQEQENESVDIVICVASFHHIPDRETREYMLQQIYRILRYGGVMITIDRSRSLRMMRKYRKAILHSALHSISSFGRHEYKTLSIPFHNNNKDVSHERVYHFFTRKELRDLCTIQGFIVDAMTYSHPDGSFSDSRSSASNICTMIRKDIFIENETKDSDPER